MVWRRRGGEKVLGIEPVVVAEVESRSVELVGAALERHVDGRPALNTVLSGRQLLHRIFPNRVAAKKRGRNPQKSGLADQLVAVKTVVIRHAVDHVVVGARPLSVDADVHTSPA